MGCKIQHLVLSFACKPPFTSSRLCEHASQHTSPFEKHHIPPQRRCRQRAGVWLVSGICCACWGSRPWWFSCAALPQWGRRKHNHTDPALPRSQSSTPDSSSAPRPHTCKQESSKVRKFFVLIHKVWENPGTLDCFFASFFSLTDENSFFWFTKSEQIQEHSNDFYHSFFPQVSNNTYLSPGKSG